MLSLNLPLHPSKQLLILFCSAYGSLLIVFSHIIFSNQGLIAFPSFFLLILSIFSLIKNIQLHVLRNVSKAIINMSYNEKGWILTDLNGNSLAILLKKHYIFSLGKFLLISAETISRRKIPIILCGHALSEANWRRLYKNLRIHTREEITQ